MTRVHRAGGASGHSAGVRCVRVGHRSQVAQRSVPYLAAQGTKISPGDASDLPPGRNLDGLLNYRLVRTKNVTSRYCATHTTRSRKPAGTVR